MNLSDWADLATVVSAVGVLVAVAALLFSWQQLKLSAGNTRAQLWLELRRMFAEHEDIHFKLGLGETYSAKQKRPDCCGKKASWPCCKKQLFKLEAYMGLSGTARRYWKRD